MIAEERQKQRDAGDDPLERLGFKNGLVNFAARRRVD
jgi:hypothetical protein